MVRGSCLCGRVAFEIDGEVSPLELCHATRCRKLTGAAFASELAAASAGFRWLRGEELLTSYTAPLLRAPPRYRNVFCRVCGSPLPARLEGTDRVVLHAGTLDEGADLRPVHHLFAGQRAPWHTIDDDLPRFEARAPRREGEDGSTT